MLNVFVTVDVEVWTDGWDLSPGRFPDYFDRYILGKSSSGEYGLRHQIRAANDRGLKFVFFVEPLFAWEFGLTPLREIVAMIREGGQSIELHLHAEWSAKSSRPILERNPGRLLRHYPQDDQARLIAHGLEMLRECGVDEIAAFRAGSFGADEATLGALSANGIGIDSSYNPAGRHFTMFEQPFYEPRTVAGIREYPLTAYRDYPGHLRQAQITASSLRELTTTMSRAEEAGRRAYVILSHSFELMNGSRRRADPVVVRRFERFCDYLADHRARFPTRWFSEVEHDTLPEDREVEPLVSTRLATLGRFAEQAVRRLVAR